MMKNTLFTLHAQTSIHAGVGAIDSVIDLPVQREAHTGYPCIFGSAVKGALRAKAEAQALAATTLLFGAATSSDNIGGNAGALLISDARILLLPIRSLTGSFRWVTCPAVLARFKKDAQRFQAAFDFAIPTPKMGGVICADTQDTLYLEEYRLEVSHDAGFEALIQALTPCLNYDNAAEMLRQQLAIISDDDFAYMAKYTLPVNAHIALDSQTKIVHPGALWYEESLPSDTVLYIGVAAAASRQTADAKTSSQVMAEFQKLFDTTNPWLQIGGNETVGMGWCYVHFAQTAEEDNA